MHTIVRLPNGVFNPYTGIKTYVSEQINHDPVELLAEYHQQQEQIAELQNKLKSIFTENQTLRYEIFCDWLPTDDCFVSLDETVKDKWGSPVAKVRIGFHQHDLKIGRYINERSKKVLSRMGAKNIRSSISGAPPANLVAGGCRFGDDPKDSVLNADCRAHDVENLYVTDGSFMPTGGSVPYTWTIYANAFRVAERIKEALS